MKITAWEYVLNGQCHAAVSYGLKKFVTFCSTKVYKTTAVNYGCKK
jgi:hypothetical protein